MLKILKVLGKSALCFIGLAGISQLLIQLDELILKWGTTYPYFFVMFKVTILEYVIWFLLIIVYTYILFRLFKSEPHCCLIIALNGLFIFVLFFVLWFMQIDSKVLFLLLTMVQVGSIPVMALGLIYKYLSGKRKSPEKVYGRAANAVLIMIKSAACLCLLVFLAFAGYVFVKIPFSDQIPMILVTPFQHARFVGLLSAIVYTGVLYILFRRHIYAVWIIAANAAVLSVLWFIAVVPDSLNLLFSSLGTFSVMFQIIVGNSAIVTLVLTFIFKSIEKRGNMENSFIKDSSVAGAPSE